jgi:hypothetical protein
VSRQGCVHLGYASAPRLDDDYWLELYVMLSRATRLEDLLLAPRQTLHDVLWANTQPPTHNSVITCFV